MRASLELDREVTIKTSLAEEADNPTVIQVGCVVEPAADVGLRVDEDGVWGDAGKLGVGIGAEVEVAGIECHLEPGRSGILQDPQDAVRGAGEPPVVLQCQGHAAAARIITGDAEGLGGPAEGVVWLIAFKRRLLTARRHEGGKITNRRPATAECPNDRGAELVSYVDPPGENIDLLPAPRRIRGHEVVVGGDRDDLDAVAGGGLFEDVEIRRFGTVDLQADELDARHAQTRAGLDHVGQRRALPPFRTGPQAIKGVARDGQLHRYLPTRGSGVLYCRAARRADYPSLPRWSQPARLPRVAGVCSGIGYNAERWR